MALLSSLGPKILTGAAVTGLALVWAAFAACTSFGTAGDPDAGLVDAVALDGAAPDASSPEASADGAIVCPPPRVTDPLVATRCPGEARDRFLATDDESCGRCGESCSGEGCLGGFCKDRVEIAAIARLLGGSEDAALVALPADSEGRSTVLARTAAGPTTLGTVTGTPRAGVVLGENAFVRTAGVLFRVGAGPSLERMIDGDRPFVTLVGGRVVTAGEDEVVSFDRSLEDQTTRDVIDVHDLVGIGASAVALIAPNGRGASGASLRIADGEGSFAALAADVGPAKHVAGRGGYAYYASGPDLWRISLAQGGRPEKVATVPGSVDAYLDAAALGAAADALRFVVARGSSRYSLYELDLCTGAVPIEATSHTNLAGVHVTRDRVYWVSDTATLRSRRIAKRKP